MLTPRERIEGLLVQAIKDQHLDRALETVIDAIVIEIDKDETLRREILREGVRSRVVSSIYAAMRW